MTAFSSLYLLHHLQLLFQFLLFPEVYRLKRCYMEHLVNNWCLRLVGSRQLRGFTLALRQTTTTLCHIQLPSTTRTR